MLKKTHEITNLTIGLTGLAISKTTELNISIPTMIGIYCGTLLPDIDHPNTKINHRFNGIGNWLSHFGHRGVTHSLLALVLISLPLIAFNQFPDNIIKTIMITFWSGLITGYFFHLCEDNLSRQGILWFWPISHYRVSRYGHPYKKRPYSQFYYTVGGKVETTWRWLCGLILIGLIIYYISLFIK